MLIHIPVLVVALPLLCAPLCLLLRNPRYLYILSLLAGSASLAACAWMLMYAGSTGEIPYRLGGWSPPFGIAYRVDLLNALVAFLLSNRFLIRISCTSLKVLLSNSASGIGTLSIVLYLLHNLVLWALS